MYRFKAALNFLRNYVVYIINVVVAKAVVTPLVSGEQMWLPHVAIHNAHQIELSHYTR